MKILKFWPIPCLLFCLYCLHTLVADSYEVLYLRRNETEPFRFLICVNLSELFPNQTEIDLKQIGGQLNDYLNSSSDILGYKKANSRRFEQFLSRMRSGYMVLNRKVCLIVKDRKELKNIQNFLPISKFVLFAMKSDTFSFIQIRFSNLNIDQLIVRKKGHPYSDCDQSNGRFFCMNECLKRRFRLARYFYQANETGRILLSYSETNRTIQESERTCFGRCKRENCKLVQMISDWESKELKTFEAEPVLSAFDFWLQIVGLILSFVGLFFDHFASTAIKLTEKLTKSRVRQRKVKVGLFYLNVVIHLLSLAYWGYLCVRVAIDQQPETDNILAREKTRNLIHPNAVHLAICVPIHEYVKGIYGKTMLEIERATDGVLVDALEDIRVTYGWRSFPSDYQVYHHKTLFKMIGGSFRRCFLLFIEPNYQTISSNPILRVRLKKFSSIYVPSLYVLSEKENLNRNSFQYYQIAFQKRIVKRMKSKGRCIDYQEKYGSCTGRQNCVERCIARKFVERYNRTTAGISFYSLAIHRNWFSPSEWNTSQLINPTDGLMLYPNVSRECEEKISDEKPCEETRFEGTVRIIQPDDQTKEIDLQFDVVQIVEELPSSLRMALDLLGIQSIFFGFTLLQLFWLVYQFTKPRWSLRHDKVVWFLVCLLCSLACSWTTVRMLDVIINGELVPTEHFEMAKRVQVPTMVFCFRINQKLIDSNHKLTGWYLEDLTNEMNVENTFKSISYLNESNEWTPFDLRLVERFFFLDMKCFRVHINQSYHRNQFHFSGDTQVLKMDFNRTKGKRLVHFMTQSKETAEFSKTVNLRYSWNWWIFGLITKYSVTHEVSLYKYEDRFSLLRRHFPPLQEGDVGDLHKQLLELQDNEPNLRTLNLPLEEKHFRLEVDEDRFDQLYSAQRQNSPNKHTNLNYRHLFVANHLRESRDFETDFNFHLAFLQRVMHFTNEVNYATLTLALLNLLSIWLELGVLDLRPFLVRLHGYLLRELLRILFFFCKWLKFKPPL